MWWKSIITIIFFIAFVWFIRMAWVTGQESNTAYLGEFILYNIGMIICAMISIGFGVWAIFS